MLANRYFGLRHGESEANLAGIVLSDPAAGTAGWGLTERGRVQVQASIAACGLSDSTRIVSSDFRRALETAELARDGLGAAGIELRVELRERAFGTWEGQSNDAYEQVWALDARDPSHRAHGVESVRCVLERLLRLLDELEASPSGQAILLVAHGDPLQILQTALLGFEPSTHREREPWRPGELRALTEAGPRTIK